MGSGALGGGLQWGHLAAAWLHGGDTRGGLRARSELNLHWQPTGVLIITGLLIGNRGGSSESWVFIWIYSNWQNSVLLEAKVPLPAAADWRRPHLGSAGIHIVGGVC